MKNQSQESKLSEPLKPFETIAIAMSGGGFRAAAYNLGVLSYLNRIKYKSPEDIIEKSLLKRVSFLSSASGGTIPAALYAAMNREIENFTFDKFYNKLYKILDGQNQLEKAFEILNDRTNWYHSSDMQVINERNLINAFAKVYDGKDFFDKMTFGIFVDSKKQRTKNEKAHIHEVCFNTTELNNGLVFRFQSDGDPATFEHVGNELVYFDKAYYDSTLSKVKLADILAASSCFPGGFEPFMFPQDFSYENIKPKRTPKKTFFSPLTSWFKEKLTDEIDEELVPDCDRLTIDELKHAVNANYDFLSTDEIKKPKEFGLVDGGVSDNQGLKSLMDADTRRRKHKKEKGEKSKLNPFDLMIVSDVDTFMAEPYVADNNERQGSFLTDILSVRFWSWLTFIFVFFGLIGIGTSIRNMTTDSHKVSLTSILGMVGLFALFYVIKIFGKKTFAIGLLLAIGIVIAIPFWTSLSSTPIPNFIFILPLLAFCVIFGGVYWTVISVINNQSKGYETWGRMIKILKNFFFGIPLSSLQRMIEARKKSVLQLTNDLFMKHIRDEYYFDFFTNKAWGSRRMPNMIYDLSAAYVDVVKKYIKNDAGTINKDPQSVYDGLRNAFRYFVELKEFMEEEAPDGPSEQYDFNDLLACGQIQIHAETARQMPTTLWFDDQQMKDGLREILIACGQYTTCHNLLIYTYKLEERAKKENLFEWTIYEKNILDLRKMLWADWMRFQNDPEFMLKS